MRWDLNFVGASSTWGRWCPSLPHLLESSVESSTHFRQLGRLGEISCHTSIEPAPRTPVLYELSYPVPQCLANTTKTKLHIAKDRISLVLFYSPYSSPRRSSAQRKERQSTVKCKWHNSRQQLYSFQILLRTWQTWGSTWLSTIPHCFINYILY